MRWMGIDGGGSTLRIVIVDDDLRVLAAAEGGAANPGSVGRDEAAARIRAGVAEALRQADGPIHGVGIGVAGAAAAHSADWLREVLAPALPGVDVFPSTDVEIALVGARARRDGVVLLAGTGSVAYGVHPDGRRRQVGGWGRLLGDEGGGYWIGLQALRRLTLAADDRLAVPGALPDQVLAAIGGSVPADVIRWTYHEASPSDVAALARLVLAAAAVGDAGALGIIEAAADALAGLAEHLLALLGMERSAVVYAGGLLTGDNPLRRAVTARLGLPAPPHTHYPPVIGAALLAKLRRDEALC